MTDEPKEMCHVRIVASWLPRDIVCVREKHEIGAHRTPEGGVFHVKTSPKPPPLRRRAVRVKPKPEPTPKKKAVVIRKKRRT